MTEQELSQLVATLFAHEWTAALALAVPLLLWLYRQRKQLAELDTTEELMAVGAPVLAVAVGGFAAGVPLQTVVLASLVKLLVGLGFNSKALPTKPADPPPTLRS